MTVFDETGGAGRFLGMTEGMLPLAFPSAELDDDPASCMFTSCAVFDEVAEVDVNRKGAVWDTDLDVDAAKLLDVG